ncbi:MAG: hypothetical protein HZC10_05830 [Nitrospirae bacterium]|nr:hypothetical protein [Nitrospirota bacterium]
MEAPFKKRLTLLFMSFIILSITPASCTSAGTNSSQKAAEENKKIIKKDDKYKNGELLVKFKEGVTEEEIGNINKGRGTEVIEVIKGIGVYRLKIISNKSVEDMVEAYSNDPRIEYAEPNYIQRTMERGIK